MQFSELYGTRLDTELGSDDRSRLFTLTRRKAAINDGVQEFARLTECYTKLASIAIVDGTAEYDLLTVTDFDHLSGQGPALKMVDADSNETWLAGRDDFPQRSVAWLDAEDPGWQQASDAAPSCWYLRRDGGHVYLGLYPGPDVPTGETWTLQVPYVAIPGTLSADADEPYTSGSDVRIDLRPYHLALVYWAAAQLEKLRKDFGAVKREEELFAREVARYFQAQRQKHGQHVVFARNYRGEGHRRELSWRDDWRR